MKKSFLLFVFFVCNTSMHCMDLILATPDCLYNVMSLLSVKNLFQSKQISKIWNKDTLIDAALSDTSSYAYQECKKDYDTGTKTMIKYAQKLHPLHPDSVDEKKLNIFKLLWESRYERFLSFQRIMLSTGCGESVVDKINFYAGHPGDEDTTQAKIYECFASCGNVPLSEIMLKENKNFQSLSSEDVDFKNFVYPPNKSKLIKDFLCGEYGRGINFVDKYGRTGLLTVIKYVFQYKGDLIEFLFTQGAKLNQIDVDDIANYEHRALLIKHGVKIIKHNRQQYSNDFWCP
jgi:hypothetical protein